jgi:hypothetical protein
MQLLYVLLLFCLLVLPTLSAEPKQIIAAKKYLNTIEQTPNGEKTINKFLASVGLGSGYSWCAAYVSFVLSESHCIEPKIRSPMAIRFINKNSILAKHVAKGYKKIDPG